MSGQAELNEIEQVMQGVAVLFSAFVRAAGATDPEFGLRLQREINTAVDQFDKANPGNTTALQTVEWAQTLAKVSDPFFDQMHRPRN
ncbi:hypothetical protein GGQ99_000956 [Aminobacter niigataensis]|uniref:Uncharacterized protein n=1 Tax=Aminobacter niigataensis TaxID=83265 RepID=A0ABR6KXI7_9HYPH|nr:hypothetical protein [Aminobacter niigataensis]MBB4649234.1 hypothetical protein [Aminobacter niigataensis]